jgi:hypothetical protein
MTDKSSATLSDGKTTYTFLLYPEEIEWNRAADYALVPVLDSDNPDLAPKSASSTISIPRVLLMYSGATKDVSLYLKPLDEWIASMAALKFKAGSISIPKLYIKRWTYRIKQTRQGSPTHVEGNLDFIIPREISTAVTATPGKKYTPRERDNITTKVKNRLKQPTYRTKLNISNPDKTGVATDESGNVTLTDTKGKLIRTYSQQELKTLGVL